MSSLINLSRREDLCVCERKLNEEKDEIARYSLSHRLCRLDETSRMGRTPTVISTKTLPTSSTLHPTSHSPTHSLLAVSSPSTSTESKVSLYRAGGNSDLVWEWTNVGEPPKPTGGLGLKGKAKAAPVGKVQQLAWSTQGAYDPSYGVHGSLHRGRHSNRILSRRRHLSRNSLFSFNSRSPFLTQRPAHSYSSSRTPDLCIDLSPLLASPPV